jgi:hypothetical protein
LACEGDSIPGQKTISAISVFLGEKVSGISPLVAEAEKIPGPPWEKEIAMNFLGMFRAADEATLVVTGRLASIATI